MSKNHIINYTKHAQNSIINKNHFLYSFLLLFLTCTFIDFHFQHVNLYKKYHYFKRLKSKWTRHA